MFCNLRNARIAAGAATLFVCVGNDAGQPGASRFNEKDRSRSIAHQPETADTSTSNHDLCAPPETSKPHGNRIRSERLASSKRQPFVPVDLAKPAPDTPGLDLFLLLGQSNMKGRGRLDEQTAAGPSIVMLHCYDDAWYHAQHPLHFTGNPRTLEGRDNAGIGPGLAFASAVLVGEPRRRIGLIPCAVGGTEIDRWQKGSTLYESALRRARIALQTPTQSAPRLRGVLWLQGEADARPDRVDAYPAKLRLLVENLRADLALPELPFVACTIVESKPGDAQARKQSINRALLALPVSVPHTACVDARDLGTIGYGVHYDSSAQCQIGRRFAAALASLSP